MKSPIYHQLKLSVFAFSILLSLTITAAPNAAIINVPGQVPTIQGAINSAVNGDVVEVAPGTYFENINFLGKAITVRSVDGAATTVIDGHLSGSVAIFLSGEGPASTLSGFTIRNGKVNFGGGISIFDASPTISNNIIVSNEANDGAGILMVRSGSLVENNKIIHNRITNSTAGGSGILIHDARGAQILRNEISQNTSPTSAGGLYVAGTSNVLIRDNLISANTAQFGGGIFVDRGTADTRIIQNVIVGNDARFGGGIGSRFFGAQIINNTVAYNTAIEGASLLVVESVGSPLIANNIFIADQATYAFECYVNQFNFDSNLIKFNNVFNWAGLAYGPNCGDQTGLNGNISADPKFVDPINRDFRLLVASPSIDAGPQLEGLPSIDFTGAFRVIDGDNNNIAVIDMGAYEHSRVPVANAGPDQTIACGAKCLATAILDGSGSFDPDGEPLSFSWTGPFGTASGATPSVFLFKGQNTITLTVTDPAGNSSSDSVVITVVDTTSPVIASVSAAPNTLIQANHQMVPVSVTVSAADNCDPASCRIVAVTSNELQEGLGDGDTAPDWEITGNLTLNLRAERSGKGSGRIYTITIECTDASGNKSSRDVTVNVPRNN